jgi:hypothetical protein
MAIAPPRRRVLDGVAKQVAHHLRQSGEITVHANRFLRDVEVQLVPGLLQLRRARLHRGLDGDAQRYARAPQGHLAAADAGEVQQVVDQPCHVPRLSFDDGARPLHRWIDCRAALQELCG